MNFDANQPGRYATVQPLSDGGRRGVPKSRLRFRCYVALLVADILAIVAGFAIGNAMRLGDPLAQAGLNILAVLLPLYVATAMTRRVYGGHIFTSWRHAAGRAIVALCTAAFAVLFISFYLQASASMSRIVFSIGILIASMAMVALRFVTSRVANRLLGGFPVAEYLIVDGVDAVAGPGVIAIDAAALQLHPNIDDPAALDRIGRILVAADRAVVACPAGRRAAWAAALKGANVRGEIVTPELADLGSLGAGHFGGQPTLAVSVGPLDLRNRALKRSLDLALSGAILLFLGPLLGLIALAVRLDSPGPILFVQPRLGRGNRLFPMFKFRSMRADQCDVHGATSTARGDARVTRVGRLIRLTSMDELPQLFNVLRGEMSIVGPRPHALGSLAGDKLFWEIDQRYVHRHAAKPGITGLAQVRGFRGATHVQSDLVDRLQADLEYLNGWSIWRDVSILFATLRVVMHRNAY